MARVYAALLACSLLLGVAISTSAGSSWASANAFYWYGPGYYEHKLACTGTRYHMRTTRGVAVGVSQTYYHGYRIRCGDIIELRSGSHTIRVTVKDHGNLGPNEFDLTALSAKEFGQCRQHVRGFKDCFTRTGPNLKWRLIRRG